MEKWTENNKSTEEDKYVDLMESLKKNKTIKDFVTKTLVDKVGERRTVTRVLEAMAEKYSKIVCEKIMDTMKKICGFWTDDKVDALIDRFEEMVTDTETLRLAERLRYALSSQFINRLEEGGKINSNEKLRLQDILEDTEGNPKDGDMMEAMKKELKRLKVSENREEPFAKETKTFYTMNENNRS